MSEACIFAKYVEGRVTLVIIFVDDIPIGSERESDSETVVKEFKTRFKISDSGEVNVYLSINITRQLTEHSMDLDQTDYILQMWKTFKGVGNSRVRTYLSLIGQDAWLLVLVVLSRMRYGWSCFSLIDSLTIQEATSGTYVVLA